MPTVEDRLLSTLLESVKVWPRDGSIDTLKSMFLVNISDYKKNRKRILDKKKNAKAAKAAKPRAKKKQKLNFPPPLEHASSVKEEEIPLPESVMEENYVEEPQDQGSESDEPGPEFYARVTARNRQITMVSREGRKKQKKEDISVKKEDAAPEERKTNSRWAMRPGKRNRSKKYEANDDEEIKTDFSSSSSSSVPSAVLTTHPPHPPHPSYPVSTFPTTTTSTLPTILTTYTLPTTPTAPTAPITFDAPEEFSLSEYVQPTENFENFEAFDAFTLPTQEQPHSFMGTDIKELDGFYFPNLK